ncbi:MAG: hypothetical protein KGJ54_06345 [Betaproteobacteria bacterium]|nr:hypothetical protein [Betaproteobacteria bacterium]
MIILFLSSYSLEPMQGNVFREAVEEANRMAERSNARRRRWQRFGLVLLALSFLLQGASAFFM